MKKFMKIVGIILLVTVLLIGALLLVLGWLSKQPILKEGFQQKIQTGGKLEAAYLQNGPYEVAVYEEAALQGFGKYIIHYPAEAAGADRQYPVIVVCNGSGTPLSKYMALPRHLASWGFIVIGTEEHYDWNGFSAEMCIRHLRRMHDNAMLGDKASPLYQKVDFGNAGVMGHSQGGVGVFSAITAQPSRSVYKTAIALSPTNLEMAAAIEWPYDPTKVSIPVMLLSGEGGGDDWVVTGEQLREIYDAVPGDKLMLRRKATTHNDTLHTATGYVTAWFMWHLQGDEAAAAAFTGADAELMHNELYQDVQTTY